MRSPKYICCLAIICLLGNNKWHYDTSTGVPLHSTVNKADDCPVIDYSGETIIIPACNKSNGSVTGLKVISSGTKQTFTWRNSGNNIVSTKLDLTGMPSDIYTLEVKDNSGCGQSVFSPQIYLLSDGVTIDEKNVVIKNSSCSNDGSITGIVVENATKYEWHNENTNAIITTPTPSLLNVGPGAYRLTATNDNGCSSHTVQYTIVPSAYLPTVFASKITNFSCAHGAGEIDVSVFIKKDAGRIDFYFADDKGVHVSDGTMFGGGPTPPELHVRVTTGVFSLYMVPADNCSYLIQTFTVGYDPLVIEMGSSLVFNDLCNQHVGAISPILNFPTTPRKTSFIWVNEKGEQIGADKFITNLGAGTYTVTINDTYTGCNATASFNITNNSPEVIPPISENITMCLPGTTGITVKNIDTTNNYNIYDSATSTTPLFTNKAGEFFMDVKETTDFYLSAKHADCESVRTKVHVFVAASGINIPTAFTPNGDGTNDFWNIANIDKFPGAEVSIFNRAGQQVYHSINYSRPFDGKYGGKQLDAGVYYYIIDLKIPICFGKVSGNLTVIR